MLENKRSVTNKQMILMVEELERDPSMSNERVLNSSEMVHDAKWEQLVEKLNAVPNGAKRAVPRWKNFLSNWKLSLKKQANSNENVDNPEAVDELGQRLLRLLEEEELVEGIDIDFDLLPNLIAPVLGYENEIELEPPQLRLINRRNLRPARAGTIRHEPYVNQQKRAKSLKTIFDNNVDRDGNPQKKIMQMQLDRLHSVSQQLESHIQDVQNRIQMIKDMWQHDCVDE